MLHFALRHDHAEALEVTDRAGESDLTETRSGDWTAVTSTSSLPWPASAIRPLDVAPVVGLRTCAEQSGALLISKRACGNPVGIA